MVYAFGEPSLRQALMESGASIQYQKGKPTRRSALRCVFQLCQVVHLLSVDGAEQTSNLVEKNNLGFLGLRLSIDIICSYEMKARNAG